MPNRCKDMQKTQIETIKIIKKNKNHVYLCMFVLPAHAQVLFLVCFPGQAVSSHPDKRRT